GLVGVLLARRPADGSRRLVQVALELRVDVAWGIAPLVVVLGGLHPSDRKIVEQSRLRTTRDSAGERGGPGRECLVVHTGRGQDIELGIDAEGLPVGLAG